MISQVGDRIRVKEIDPLVVIVSVGEEGTITAIPCRYFPTDHAVSALLDSGVNWCFRANEIQIRKDNESTNR